MRILLLNYEYPPLGGGAGNATRNTAIELARRGHQVHVLTSRSLGQPRMESSESVTVFRVWSLPRSLHECGLAGAASYVASAFVRLARLARAHDYDVYHFYFGLPTAALALFVHFVLGKPYIIALRGSDVPGYDDARWGLSPLHAILRPLSRFLWRRAHSVTVLSKDLHELASRTAPDVPKSIIGNGVDEERFPHNLARLRGGPVRLLTVCRLVPRKGLEFLLEAMEALKHDGVTLEIVGSGRLEGRLAALIHRRGLDAYVTLTGYIPAERLRQHYHAADIFVLPSLSESFGQVLLEAMSCGLPIVASAIGGIPETVEHENGGLLVPARDAGALVEAIRRLAGDPCLREQMGRHNALLARTRHGWPAIASEYETLYYGAVGETDRVPGGTHR